MTYKYNDAILPDNDNCTPNRWTLLPKYMYICWFIRGINWACRWMLETVIWMATCLSNTNFLSQENHIFSASHYNHSMCSACVSQPFNDTVYASALFLYQLLCARWLFGIAFICCKRLGVEDWYGKMETTLTIMITAQQ